MEPSEYFVAVDFDGVVPRDCALYKGPRLNVENLGIDITDLTHGLNLDFKGFI